MKTNEIELILVDMGCRWETKKKKIERGLHALYGGIKKYEETDTSQHDVSG